MRAAHSLLIALTCLSTSVSAQAMDRKGDAPAPILEEVLDYDGYIVRTYTFAVAAEKPRVRPRAFTQEDALAQVRAGAAEARSTVYLFEGDLRLDDADALVQQAPACPIQTTIAATGTLSVAGQPLTSARVWGCFVLTPTVKPTPGESSGNIQFGDPNFGTTFEFSR